MRDEELLERLVVRVERDDTCTALGELRDDRFWRPPRWNLHDVPSVGNGCHDAYLRFEGLESSRCQAGHDQLPALHPQTEIGDLPRCDEFSLTQDRHVTTDRLCVRQYVGAEEQRAPLVA